MNGDFVKRPRCRHLDNTESADLERKEIVIRGFTQEEICADRGIDQVEKSAQNLIFIDIRDRLKNLNEFKANRHHAVLFTVEDVAPLIIRAETGLEIAVEHQRYAGIINKRKRDTLLGELTTDLEIIVSIATENIDLFPAETGQDLQSIQVIIFDCTTA